VVGSGGSVLTPVARDLGVPSVGSGDTAFDPAGGMRPVVSDPAPAGETDTATRPRPDRPSSRHREPRPSGVTASSAVAPASSASVFTPASSAPAASPLSSVPAAATPGDKIEQRHATVRDGATAAPAIVRSGQYAAAQRFDMTPSSAAPATDVATSIPASPAPVAPATAATRAASITTTATSATGGGGAGPGAGGSSSAASAVLLLATFALGTGLLLRRLFLPPARWRPLHLIAVLERPG
jgi:hypothetical protein